MHDHTTDAAVAQVVVKERYVAPTVLTDVLPSNPLMHDELFAPLLPVIAIESMDDAIDYVNNRGKTIRRS